MNNFFDNQRILNLIWKRKIHFVIVGIIAIVLSAVFSGPAFIKPKYRSTARIYPTNNIAVFSEESETEQILEIINSNDLKQRVFESLRLDTVYHVKRESPYFYTEMMDMYNTNIKTSKTEYETVQIKVLDENPVIAKLICDSIIHFTNKIIGEMHSIKYMEVVALTDKFMNLKKHELDSVENRLKELRNKLGIISYDSQLERITEGYMLTLSGNKSQTSDGKIIKEYVDNLKEHGSEIYKLENRFKALSNLVDSLNIVKEINLLEAQKDISFSHIVEHPVPADKKSYPVRWLIVLFSTVSAVFLALLVFLVLDYRKNE